MKKFKTMMKTILFILTIFGTAAPLVRAWDILNTSGLVKMVFVYVLISYISSLFCGLVACYFEFYFDNRNNSDGSLFLFICLLSLIGTIKLIDVIFKTSLVDKVDKPDSNEEQQSEPLVGDSSNSN